MPSYSIVSEMHTTIQTALSEVPQDTWNTLVPDNHPFLKHQFLSALERHGCVGKDFGWIPQHILLHNEEGKLIGAMPLYLKYNSYGEFVFDMNWAQAYHRAHLEYYPKLVSAIPFTPATSHRLLYRPGDNPEAIKQALTSAAIAHAEKLGISSIHWLFPTNTQHQFLMEQGLLSRLDCHFHWSNEGYRDFNDFLDHLKNRKRKSIRRERRHVKDEGIDLKVLQGNEMSEEEWRHLYHFYCLTFERKYGTPTLNLPFFLELSSTMGEQIVVILAFQGNRCIAGALNFRSDSTLYGRHWGCYEGFHSLHFEACYYQGLEYCIRHGLDRFEPGVQGEYKISRGFLPTATRSAHWIADPQFREVIAKYVAHEETLVQGYMEGLAQHSPFKQQS